MRSEESYRRGWCSRTASRLRKDATKSELVFRIKLLDAGFNQFRFQKFFNDENIFIVDFFLWRTGLIIEIDGGYHFTKEQIKADSQRDSILIKHKLVNGILRISDDQAMSLKAEDISGIIKCVKNKEILVLY